MTVCLIDGRNCLYRFGWALNNLRTSDGTKTGAVYGLLSCMLRLKTKYEDARFVVVWDGPGYRKAWRSKLFTEYKANRAVKQTEETRQVLMQFGPIKKCLKLMGVAESCLDEFECDDLIGVLTTQCVALGWKTVIYSSDKDFMQLMDMKGVHLIRDVAKPSRLRPEDATAVYEHFKCDIKDVLKVRAICGDPSDGIPGVMKGVGPVRAAAFVGQCRNWNKALKENPGLERNYRLMKILRDLDDPELTLEHKQALDQEVARVLNVLHGSVQMERDHRDRRALMEVLAELELQELLDRRVELWNLGVYGAA
jgi:DNA polymerase I